MRWTIIVTLLILLALTPTATAQQPTSDPAYEKCAMADPPEPTPVSCEKPATCHTPQCAERVARKRCSNDNVASCIRRAALHHHVSERVLRRKARCESGDANHPDGNPRARSGPSAGLFQFIYDPTGRTGTWATTPYAGHSPWFAKWSALAAAWMHRVGRGREWTCR